MTNTRTNRFSRFTRVNMKIALLSFVLFMCLPMHAKKDSRFPQTPMQAHQTPFESTSSYLRNSADKTAAVAFGSAHTPTVYTPFSNESPSNSGSNSDQSSGISGRRNAIGNPGNPGQDQNNTDSPLGDAWSLLVFAAIAAIVIKARGERLKAKG